MAKKPITWLELVKQKLNALKAKGEHPSIRDVMDDAKKDWASIKKGTNALYEQGKSKFLGKKKTKKLQKDKKQKKGKTLKMDENQNDVSTVMAEIKSMLCPKCKLALSKKNKKKNTKKGGRSYEDVEDRKREMKEDMEFENLRNEDDDSNELSGFV